ncbi:MAG: carboxypeptidase regulatory-like domain-containing protein [Planctomycetota bacterium]
MLDRREFVFLLLFAAAVLLAFVWPAETTAPAGSLPATAGIEDADPATDITGVVVDVRGRPVGGALITSDLHLFGRAPLYLPDWTRPEIEGPTTVTARDGTFVLTVGHGEIADFCVRPQVHGEAMVAWRRPGDHLRITVTDGADVVVTVRERTGEPVADARVVLLVDRPAVGDILWHSGVTNAAGRHTFSRLSAAGVVRIFARESGRESRETTTTIPTSGRVTADLTLPKVARSSEDSDPPDFIAGRVLDPAGNPLPGARIATECDQGMSDVSGRFRLRSRGHGNKIAIWAPGYGRVAEATEGWSGSRDIRLGPGRVLSGRVLDASGAVQPDVRVDLVGEDLLAPEHALSDARGSFRFADLSPGKYLVAVMPGNERGCHRRIVVEPDADRTDVELRLP